MGGDDEYTNGKQSALGTDQRVDVHQSDTWRSFSVRCCVQSAWLTGGCRCRDWEPSSRIRCTWRSGSI